MIRNEINKIRTPIYPYTKETFTDIFMKRYVPQYCYIAPIEYLSYTPHDTTMHLTLAHLLDNKSYVDYYNFQHSMGKTIILDNSAFEFKEPLTTQEIFDLMNIHGFKADYIVAPDYPFQPWEKTYNSAVDFTKELKEKSPHIGVMSVPQSEKGDVEGWIECWKAMINNPDIDIIGYSILGIPNAFCEKTGTEDISFNRMYAASMLRNILENNESLYNNFRDKWHHFLGASDIREIKIQKQIGIMDSIDSSSVFWSAICGKRYDDSYGGLKDGKVQIPVDFNVKVDYININNILHNIKYMKSHILV